VQLSGTQFEDVHGVGLYHARVFLLLLGRCWFSVLGPCRFNPDSLWIVSYLGSVPYWHDLIVFVRLRTRAARFYCFSVPTVVTRTLLIVTLKNTLHSFFSNIQTQQLVHDQNIPQTKQQHAAVKYSNSWITWVLGKLLCRRYYGSCAVGITEVVLLVLQKLCCGYYRSCAVGITEAVLSVLQKLCCRYYRSCAVGITEVVLSVLQKLYCRYNRSCTVGITEAVLSVLQKLYCRYYRSCTVGITEAVLSVLQKLCCPYFRSCAIGIT